MALEEVEGSSVGFVERFLCLELLIKGESALMASQVSISGRPEKRPAASY